MSKLTDQDKIDIVNLYINNLDCKVTQLAKKYFVTPPAIKNILKVRGVKIRSDLSKLIRKYKMREDYFEIIDTEDKAYFLGLLYADGYNGVNYRGSYSTHISLTEKDVYILESMRNYIFIDKKPLSFLKPYIDKRKNGKILNIKGSASLSIYSKIFGENLKRLGCFQNKSLTLKFPTPEQVPEHLLNHFIRGYFDGDGCIHEAIKNENNKSYMINIVSSLYFCKSLYQILNNLDMHIKIKNGEKVSNIIFSSKKDVKIFYNYIYKNSTLFLTRKKDIFERAIKYYSINHRSLK